ncbi:GTPase-activating protein gyp3 [Cladobotryum mycophilum]|uniref:GTPase-activating protein gyp3 n=1 Tax=Cladobotryum mycophilum TaxID=491253 RepID=A0ABR0SX27_9HYPO
MSSMAISHTGESHRPVSRKQSIGGNRQISLYASRIKSPSPPPPPQRSQTTPPGVKYDGETAPQLPQIPPYRSPTSSPTSHSQVPWQEQPHPQPHPRTHHAGPLPVRDISRIISEAHSEFPLSPKSPGFDMHMPEHPPVENFSRPRKPSIKQPVTEPAKLRLAYVPPPLDLMHELHNGLPSTPATSRHRRQGHSVSSSNSAHNFPSASPLYPPPGDYLESSRSSRSRNGTSPPVSGNRSPFGFNRIDSAVSVPTPSGSAPWISGDELRSSFRSQLTASTAPGTAFTERSSVLTKVSSQSSLDAANPDEPSLEDVMGMYERGFCDDDDEEEDYQDDQDHDHVDDDKPDPGDNLDRRPTTAMSEPAQTTRPIDAFDVPAAQSALDAEIRQSKMLFTSLAFTSTVPALASHGLSFPQRRESARTVESERSVASEPPRNEAKVNSTHMSRPSITLSRSTSPASARIPVPEPEDPEARDRYGFKKESQYVTRAQYDSWNKTYTPYLARRRRKWIAYLKDNALMTERPNRFPSPNAKTKRFVRKGIPPDWRGAAWFYYAGGPAILAKHSGLYDKLLLRKAKQIDIEAIERDLHRTFPDNIQFKPSGFAADRLETTTSSERASQSTMTGSTSDGSGPGPVGLEGEPPIISSLRRILLAFSVYNPKIGYCQSLNFIAGLLLLFVETEEQCFWLLNVITHIYLPGTHEMSLEGSKVDLGVLMTELRDTMPGVWDKIGGELETEPVTRPMTSKSVRKSPRTPRLRRKDMPGLSTERLPPITLCMTAWFMSCYIGTLPIEATLRVWDVFFYEGSKTLFRVALAIFKLGESEIKAVSDPMEMFGVVQTMPRRMLDANQLMEACFRRRNGFNHLSQDVIEERRQERREKVRQDLQRQRGKTVTGGNLTQTEAEGEAQKKGTLFGKKKKTAEEAP